jgi:taurine dioxygenase
MLDRLYFEMKREEFVERFVWKPGSIAFWDNRATWHFAQNDYQGHRREMHRITIEGEPLRRYISG